MEHLTTFDEWRAEPAESPADVLSRFRHRIAEIDSAEVDTAVAYLPEAGGIPDTPDTAGTAELLNLINYGDDWKDLPLAGVPFLVKDLYDVAGWPTAASSLFLASEYGIPDTSSALVRCLQRLGATPVGKTHLNEFAYGLSGRNPHYGDCPHPRFPDRLTGGSSSGSAWAVGKGVVPLALGTDTGGSVRTPAAFCGIYGLRLVPNEWSREGCFPLAPSFDTAGWFTATGDDMRTSIDLLIGPRPGNGPLKGVLLKPAGLALAPWLEAAYGDVIDRLDAGADPGITDLFRAVSGEVVKHYAVLQSGEAFSIHERWLDRYRDQYNPAVWQRIDRGRHWTIREIEAAETGRRRMKEFFDTLFKEYDYAVLYAVNTPALGTEGMTEDFRNQILTLTTPASMATLPVLTVPVMLENGLSGGLQIIYGDPASDIPNRFLELWLSI